MKKDFLYGELSRKQKVREMANTTKKGMVETIRYQLLKYDKKTPVNIFIMIRQKKILKLLCGGKNLIFSHILKL